MYITQSIFCKYNHLRKINRKSCGLLSASIGNPDDATRKPEFYDPTFNFLKGLGLEEI